MLSDGSASMSRSTEVGSTGSKGNAGFCTEQEASLPVGEKRRRAPPASSALCRGRCRSDDSRGRLLWTTTVSPSLLRCNSPIRKEERLTIDANTGRPCGPAGRPAGHTTRIHDCLVETLRTLSTETSTASSRPSNRTAINSSLSSSVL